MLINQVAMLLVQILDLLVGVLNDLVLYLQVGDDFLNMR